MRTYLEFQKMRKKKGMKTDRWKVIHVDSIYPPHPYLGMIKWHGGWWQYVFEPAEGSYWSKGCLEQVAKFLKKCNTRQRIRWKAMKDAKTN